MMLYQSHGGPIVLAAENLVEFNQENGTWLSPFQRKMISTLKLGSTYHRLMLSDQSAETNDALQQLKMDLFLDLKLYDTPKTIWDTVSELRQISSLRYLTVTYAYNNEDSLRAALEAAGNKITLLGVSRLTSMSFNDTQTDDFRHALDTFAELGFQAVITPASLAGEARIRGLRPICPGIVFDSTVDVAGQKQLSTPEDAFSAGADQIVIGRAVEMLDEPQIFQIYEQWLLAKYQRAGHFWRREDEDPKHVQLTSGNHSDGFINTTESTSSVEFMQTVSKLLVEKLRQQRPELFELSTLTICGQAQGSINFANSLASYLAADGVQTRVIFTEKTADGKMKSRFHIYDNEPLLAVEDVLSTGSTTLKTVDCLESRGGRVYGTLTIIDRRPNGAGGELQGGIPVTPAVRTPLSVFAPEDCPFCKNNEPLISKPKLNPEVLNFA